jgi:hypothetical protein
MTSSSRHLPGLAATNRRLGNRAADILLVQHASRMIAELGLELDRQLADERRPAERLRMLRETTNRITRVANDAVQAYRRTSRALHAELERPDADHDVANALRAKLETGRRDVLNALEAAQARYPAPLPPPAG